MASSAPGLTAPVISGHATGREQLRVSCGAYLGLEVPLRTVASWIASGLPHCRHLHPFDVYSDRDTHAWLDARYSGSIRAPGNLHFTET
jgi:hypothetical protein